MNVCILGPKSKRRERELTTLNINIGTPVDEYGNCLNVYSTLSFFLSCFLVMFMFITKASNTRTHFQDSNKPDPKSTTFFSEDFVNFGKLQF